MLAWCRELVAACKHNATVRDRRKLRRVPLLRPYPCAIGAAAGGSAPVPDNHDEAWKPSASKMKRAADEGTYGGDEEKICLGSAQVPNALDEDRTSVQLCYICGMGARSPMR